MHKRKPDPRDGNRSMGGAAPTVRVFSQLGVRLPADLAARLKGFSLRSGQSLNSLVAAALQRYLDQEDSVRPHD